MGPLSGRGRKAERLRRDGTAIVRYAVRQRVVATGPGIYLSTDGGRTWEQMFSIPEGAGPVAWSKSEPEVAYVVGFNQKLYKTTDGGRIWLPVVEEAR